ncbi:PREDICTED: tRNA (guanine(10)-N2)-methyltransferase homolog isoform X2 [Priapulus caudatus]|uniref:tRNA (guanine(10)-N(2))-methyltransferase TRMT11 n=1 Tax=Priapulus caudatus TaxID=37621 RepID=A0ABM1DPQ8_PRICU|nr:PREDICTED: tRNA (guanine(10)-N2)-methyltransferase homolog isoform X2 [Priapulus caudatus]
MSEILVFFTQTNILEFKLPELKTLAKLSSVPLTLNENSHDKKNPFLVLDLQSEDDAKRLMKRTVLMRSMYELWASAKTHDDLYSQLAKCPHHLKAQYVQRPDGTFRVKVDAFGKKLQDPDRQDRLDKILGILPFEGKVKLNNPDQSFHLLELYGQAGSKTPDKPLRVYFGRWLMDGQRDQIRHYHLQKRQYIGNTSMDSCLSLLMANQAMVTENALVCDPFVGTGSLLVAAAGCGAYVTGTDIDYNVLHGKGKSSRYNQIWKGPDENIRSNLRQYGLEHCYLDVMQADFSKCIWREQPLFDAIITDPPYGIRESTRKIGSDKNNLVNHEQYTVDNIPQHPCLELVANSEQPLSVHVSRRLITMRKHLDYEEARESELQATVSDDHYTESFRYRYFHSAGVPEQKAKADARDEQDPLDRERKVQS